MVERQNKLDTLVSLSRNDKMPGVEVVGEKAYPGLNRGACNKRATATTRVVVFLVAMVRTF